MEPVGLFAQSPHALSLAALRANSSQKSSQPGMTSGFF